VSPGATFEIRDPEGAFERLDAHLRAQGFLSRAAGDDRSRWAEVYLGFGLSEPLRRNGRPAAPEPLALPLAACRVVDAAIEDAVQVPAPRPGPRPRFRLGAWERTWSTSEHAAAVRTAREAIADGEIYQVNIVQHLSAPFAGSPAAVATALRRFDPLHPRPFVGDGWAIVSASPELFLARAGRRIRTMPIKGTRPSGAAEELHHSTKDAAEHVMIVDLERNDLGRVCVPGSVAWPELMRVRSMTGVEHLVSSVEGTLREDVTLPAILSALFPGGSVTGAPKVAALDHINLLEPVGRGASMGALGRIWPNGDMELALTIRTFAIADERIHLWVGGGVIWDSDADAEVEESWVKARPLLNALAEAGRGDVVDDTDERTMATRQGAPGVPSEAAA
jgi:para-aminobenzoate synthetase component 1